MATKSDIPGIILALCGPKDDLGEARARSIEAELATLDRHWGEQSLPTVLFVSSVMRNLRHAHEQGGINSIHLPVALSLLGRIGEVLLASLKHQNGPDVNPHDSSWIEAYKRMVVFNNGGRDPFTGSFETALDEVGNPLGSHSHEPYQDISDTKPENVVELKAPEPDPQAEADAALEEELATFEAMLKDLNVPSSRFIDPETAERRSNEFLGKINGLLDRLAEHWDKDEILFVSRIANNLHGKLTRATAEGDLNKFHLIAILWFLGQLGQFYHEDWRAHLFPELPETFDPLDPAWIEPFKRMLDRHTKCSIKQAAIIPFDPSCPADSPPTPSTGSEPTP